jgi:hypothetical protein
MITNAFNLTNHQKMSLAEKVSTLSHKANSSLLPRSVENVLSDVEKQIIFVEIQQGQPLFLIAFEPTGNPLYIEVGMTCNISPDKIRGKHIFPPIIDFYRHTNGNGKKILYLTTTDIRMIKVAGKSGFKQLEDICNFFPPEVLDFCCSPCLPEKTGVAKMGQQKNHCSRFEGQFLPKFVDDCTHQPCRIFAQII